MFHTMDDPSYSSLAKFISVFIMVIILVSTIGFILESEVTTEGGILYSATDSTAEDTFQYIELGCVIIFTLEYIV